MDLVNSFFSSLVPSAPKEPNTSTGPGPYIYHERQQAALCGRHCLNNLLQGPYFDDFDLAEIAHQLDARERELMLSEGTDTADAIRFVAEDSGNVDASGNFSITVLNEAIKRSYGLNLVSATAEGEKPLDNPEREFAFVCNLESHWFVLRRLYGQWLDLNSLHKRPKLITDFYLSVYLTQLVTEGYSIFVIRGAPLPEPMVDRSLGEAKHWHSLPALHALPQTAAHGKQTRPAPHEVQGSGADDDGLAAAIAASLRSSGDSGTAAAFVDLSGEPEEEDDDVLLARAISLSAAAAAAPTPVSVPPPASVPVVADEPPIGTPGSATIKLRLPQGTASTVPLVHRFNGEDSGSALFQWIDSVISPAPFPYDVCLPNGSAKLTRSDAATKSLLQLGFVPNVMLTVIRVASS